MSMGDLLYERKFNDMKKYIPFLKNVIHQLKNQKKDNPRKAQLQKLEMLYNLLTDKRKKLKIETLLKCESVMKKLHMKIEKQYGFSQCEDTKKQQHEEGGGGGEPASLTTSSSTSAGSSSSSAKKTPPATSETSTTKTAKHSEATTAMNERKGLRWDIAGPASPTDISLDTFGPPVVIPTERNNSPHAKPSLSSSGRNASPPRNNRNQPNTTIRPSRWDVCVGRNPDPPASYKHESSGRYRQRHRDDEHETMRKDSISSRHPQSPEPPPAPLMHVIHGYRKPYSRKQRNEEIDVGSSSLSPSSSKMHHHVRRECDDKQEAYSPTKQWEQQDSSRLDSQHQKHWRDKNSCQFGEREAANRSYSPVNRTTYHHYPPSAYGWGKPQTTPTIPPLPQQLIKKNSCNREANRLESQPIEANRTSTSIYKWTKPSTQSAPVTMLPMAAAAAAPPAQQVEKNVFNRLGGKVDLTSSTSYTNFKILVRNDKLKSNPSSSEATSTKTASSSSEKAQSTAETTPAQSKVSPIDEVLRSPPLSANDIVDLLGETPEDVSVVGQRRTAKPQVELQPPSTPLQPPQQAPLTFTSQKIENNLKPPDRDTNSPSNLDAVRKKLAIISKNSSSSTSVALIKPKISDSSSILPISTTPSNAITTAASPLSGETERLALKYHPRPRKDKPKEVDCVLESAIHKQQQRERPVDPRTMNKCMLPHTILASAQSPPQSKASAAAGGGLFPVINASDPRLKRTLMLAPAEQGNTGFFGMSPIHLNSAAAPAPALAHPSNVILPGLFDVLLPKPSAVVSSSQSSLAQTNPAIYDGITNNQTLKQKIVSQPHQSTPPTATNKNPGLFQHSVPKANSSFDVLKTHTCDSNVGGQQTQNHQRQQSQRCFEDTNEKQQPPMVASQLDPRTNRAPLTQHHHQSIYSQHNYKFNAMLNDQSERLKYLESKKQKHVEPRTYAEYKKIKYRQLSSSLDGETKAQVGDVASDCDSSALSSTAGSGATPTQSNLDKMYRTSNYGRQDLTKSTNMTNFKIPKKPQEVEIAKELAILCKDTADKLDGKVIPTAAAGDDGDNDGGHKDELKSKSNDEGEKVENTEKLPDNKKHKSQKDPVKKAATKSSEETPDETSDNLTTKSTVDSAAKKTKTSKEPDNSTPKSKLKTSKDSNNLTPKSTVDSASKAKTSDNLTTKSTVDSASKAKTSDNLTPKSSVDSASKAKTSDNLTTKSTVDSASKAKTSDNLTTKSTVDSASKAKTSDNLTTKSTVDSASKAKTSDNLIPKSTVDSASKAETSDNLTTIYSESDAKTSDISTLKSTVDSVSKAKTSDNLTTKSTIDLTTKSKVDSASKTKTSEDPGNLTTKFTLDSVLKTQSSEDLENLTEKSTLDSVSKTQSSEYSENLTQKSTLDSVSKTQTSGDSENLTQKSILDSVSKTKTSEDSENLTTKSTLISVSKTKTSEDLENLTTESTLDEASKTKTSDEPVSLESKPESKEVPMKTKQKSSNTNATISDMDDDHNIRHTVERNSISTEDEIDSLSKDELNARKAMHSGGSSDEWHIIDEVGAVEGGPSANSKWNVNDDVVVGTCSETDSVAGSVRGRNRLTCESDNETTQRSSVARRIRARRQTMCESSSDELDNNKKTNLSKKLQEDAAAVPAASTQVAGSIKTRRKSYVDSIFKETDDNCNVSTQNIIEGKRRTRTTANFNEVKSAAAQFNKNKKADVVVPVKKVETPIKKIDTPPGPKKTDTQVEKSPVVRTTRSTVSKKTTPVSKKVIQLTTTTGMTKAKGKAKKSDSFTAANEDGQTQSGDVEVKNSADEVAAAAAAGATVEEPKSDHHKLDGFFKSLTAPNACTNRQRMFDMLKTVLDDNALQQVKTIIEDAARLAEEEADGDDEVLLTEWPAPSPALPSVSSAGKDIKSFKRIAGVVAAKKIHRPKKTELDRLNEDIRDMFISKGVLTATGRRMCTLVHAPVGGDDSSTTKKKPTPSTPTTASNKNKTQNTPTTTNTPSGNQKPMFHIRKAKVVIRPLNLRSLRSGMLKSDLDGDDSDDDDSDAAKMKPPSLQKIGSPPALTSRQMPILKPNTPIKLPEEDDLKDKLKMLAKEKNSLKRPCPKSKRENILYSDDDDGDGASEDDLQLSHLKKKIKKEPLSSAKTRQKPKDEDEDDDGDDDEDSEATTIASLCKKKKKNRILSDQEDDDDDDDDDEEDVAASSTSKLSTKGKVKNTNVMVDDSDDYDEEEDEQSNKVTLKSKQNSKKATAETKCVPKSKTFSRIVQEVNESSSSDESANIDDANNHHQEPHNNEKKDHMLPPPKTASEVVRNTNRDWHTHSEYVMKCVLCDAKQRFIAMHYRVCHNGSEVFVSRLPPDILASLKQNNPPNRPELCILAKNKLFKHQCPFCQMPGTLNIRYWIEHMRIHTGEYAQTCSVCYKGFNGIYYANQHIKQRCPNGMVILREQIPIIKSTVVGHVCHLCDYIQFLRDGLDSHYINHHDVSPKEAPKLGYHVNLIDCNGVPCDKTKKSQKNHNNEMLLHRALGEEEKEREKCTADKNEEKKKRPKESTADDDQELTTVLQIVDEENSNDGGGGNENPVTPSSLQDDHQPLTGNRQTDCSSKQTNSLADNNNSNWKNIFMSRDDVASPTSDDLTERLRSIDRHETMAASAAMGECSTANNSAATTNMTMVDRLSQRLKNLEKQPADVTETETVAERQVSNSSTTKERSSFLDRLTTRLATTPLQQFAAADAFEGNSSSCSFDSSSIPNGNVEDSSCSANDEAVNGKNKTTAAPNNEVDDNDDNWEDIEITESSPLPLATNVAASAASASATAASSVGKEKTKSKSLFQTMSRIFASVKGNNAKTKKPKVMMGKPKIQSNNQSGDNSQTPITAAESSHDDRVTESQSVPSPPPQIVSVQSLYTETCMESATGTSQQPQIVSVESLSSESAEKSASETMQPQIVSVKSLANLTDLLPTDLVPADSSYMDPLATLGTMDDINFFTLLDSNFDSIGSNSLSPTSMLEQIPDYSLFPLTDGEQQQSVTTVTPPPTAAVDTTNALALASSHPKAFTISPPRATIKTMVKINRITNLGFSRNSADNKHKFYCIIHACSFIFSDEAIGLENHFLLEHPTIKWHGFCHTCDTQIYPPEPLTLLQEMKHMLDCHTSVNLLASKATASVRPRITLRRLSGDKLSNSPLPTTPTPMVQQTKKQLMETSLLDLLSSEARAMTVPPTLPSVIGARSTLHQMASAASSSSPSSSSGYDTICHQSAAATGEQQNDTMPLFKNISSDFAITSVTSGAGDQNFPTDFQISNVFSLGRSPERNPPVTATADAIPLSSSQESWRTTSETVGHEIVDGNSSSDIISRALSNLSPLPSPEKETTPSAIITNSRPYFKCMAIGCKYTTRVPVAMSEHLHFHMRRNFSSQMDWMRCCQCLYVATSVTDYLHHAEMDQHPNTNNAKATWTPPAAVVVPQVSTASSLTQKIKDILQNSNRNSSSGTDVVATSSITSDAATANENFYKQLEEAAKDKVASTGIDDAHLYTCVVPKCKTLLNEGTFHTHLMFHLATSGSGHNNHIKCAHCSSVYHRPAGIKAHIRSHSRHRYLCYMCTATAPNVGQIHKHFNDTHWRVTTVSTQPLIPRHASDKPVFYVCNDILLKEQQLRDFGEKLIAELQRKKSALKTHFNPKEINLLPIQPIFNNEIFCSVCNYKTKVRTNMLRHLQLHKTSESTATVGSVDPVNPVPCLNSNERHFDKMSNLACSSNNGAPPPPPTTTTTSSATATPTPTRKIPIYVPESQRYVCNLSGCQYLSISDAIFRAHLCALHSTEQRYSCPHCQEEICKKGMVIENIIHHLRLHGPLIYQCQECEYMHHKKHLAERHIREKHATLKVNMITHDRETGPDVIKTVTLKIGKKYRVGVEMTSSANQQQGMAGTSIDLSGFFNGSGTAASSNQNPKNKWECAICKHRTITWNKMVSHANTQHNSKNQYQCVHCSFGSSTLANVMYHIGTDHPTKKRAANCIFQKINESEQEKAADTRPLWSRDDPTRVRHIRGILMENEDEAEANQQNLVLDDDDDDEEDDDNAQEDQEEFINIEQDEVLNRKEFFKLFTVGCYYCEFKCKDIAQLQTHMTIFQSQKGLTTDEQRKHSGPFYFRLHSNLKCVHCSFVGSHFDMQVHLQNVHKWRHSYAATDPEKPDNCGYCPYEFLNIDMLTKHHNRVEHKPTDLKQLSPPNLKTALGLGRAQTYMRCNICGQMCADKCKMLEHKRDKHHDTTTTTTTTQPNKEGGDDNSFHYKEISGAIFYRCAICQFTSTDELVTLRHMIDHYGRFKRCQFCADQQPNFDSYMQHCYTEHRNEITRFSVIYTLEQITKFLGQMFVMFPNGLNVNKKNLWQTQYGSENHIKTVYREICKTSQEPPIPRLSIARLVARKSIELCASDSESAAAAAPSTKSSNRPAAAILSARPIAKRRSTFAPDGREPTFRDELSSSDRLNNDENCIAFSSNSKKRKQSDEILAIPPPPLFANSCSSIPEASSQEKQNRNDNSTESSKENNGDDDEEDATTEELQPYSFYGKRPQKLDLSKIQTKIAIGGKYAQVSCSKFALLFKINTRVLVERIDIAKYTQNYKKNSRPCPASRKFKYP